MHLKGDYDATQDRILLRLRGAPIGNVRLWLTRRHWLAIALACDRACLNAVRGDEQPRPRRSEADDYEDEEDRALEPSLVTTLKFQHIAYGLRIRLTSEDGASYLLPLTGDNLQLFARLVKRLAAKAKWDLPAAISRLKNGATPEKRFVN